jgi:hypothetical protein
LLLQVTARWGPDVIGVWRVDSRDGFVFDDVVVVAPSETWSETSPATASPYRDTGGVEVSFAIEALGPRWGRAPGKLRAAFIAAFFVSIAAHTGFAFAASHAHTPSEEEAAVDRFVYMRRVLFNADEREQEESDAANDNTTEVSCLGGCMSGPMRFRSIRRYSIWWWDETIRPTAPDWCGAYGDFWMITHECIGPLSNDVLFAGPSLSPRVLIDGLDARIPPDNPRVRGTIVTEGAGQERGVIGREIRVAEQELARCYETTLALYDPDHESHMTARYTIDSAGGTSLRLDTEVPSEDLYGCVYRVLLATRFPPHPVRYSLAFTLR